MGEMAFELYLEANPMCPICFEELEIENLRKIKCNHIFHKDCIFRWAKEHSTCPMCRDDSLAISGDDLIDKVQLEAKAKKKFLIGSAIYVFIWTFTELLCTLSSPLNVLEFLSIQYILGESMLLMFIMSILPRCYSKRAYVHILRQKHFFKVTALSYFFILC